MTVFVAKMPPLAVKLNTTQHQADSSTLSTLSSCGTGSSSYLMLCSILGLGAGMDGEKIQ